MTIKKTDERLEELLSEAQLVFQNALDACADAGLEIDIHCDITQSAMHIKRYAHKGFTAKRRVSLPAA